MSVFSERFIEEVITPESETTNPSETMNVTRKFNGMEAVAQFEEDDSHSKEGDE